MKHFNYLLLYILIFFCPNFISAQNKGISNHFVNSDTCQLPLFQERININSLGGVFDIKVTPDKGYIISGVYSPVAANRNSIFLIKLNSFGVIEWQKGIHLNANPVIVYRFYPRKVMVTSDGGYALFSEHEISTMNHGSMLTRFDKNGNLLWNKNMVFETQGHAFTDAIATSDNGFAFISLNTSRSNVCKLNANGNVTWVKHFSIPAGSVLHMKGITELNNSFYLVGTGSSIQGLNKVNVLVNLDKVTGQFNWCKSFGSNSNFQELAITSINSFNNKLIVGGSFDLDQTTGRSNQGVLRLTANGVLEKAIKIQNANNRIHTDNLFEPMPLSEDGYYAGHTLIYYDPNVNTLFDTAAIIYRLNDEGQIIWQRRYNHWQGSESVVSIRNTVDGGFVAAGVRLGALPASTSIQILKADTAGSTGGCVTRTPNLTSTVVNLPTVDVILQQVNIILNVPQDIELTITEPNFTRELFCSANMECDNIKINGEDSICDKRPSYLYTITKNNTCAQPVVWDVSNASIAQITAQTDTTVTIKYLGGGTVKLFAKFQLQCSSIADSLSIYIFNNPDTVDLGPDLNLCINGFYELNARSGFKTYLWQNGSTDSTYTITVPGNYYVTVTDSCGNTSSDSVVVIAGPSEILDIGNDSIICRKDTITLNATPGFISYSWTPNYNITNTSGNSTQVFPYQDTIYKVVATKRPGCTLLDSIKISLFPTTIIALGNDTSICTGTSVTLDAGSGFQSYLWSNGASSQQITVSQKAKYSISATDINGCKSTDTLEILNIFPNPRVSLAKDTLLCEGKPLTLDAGAGYQNYLWQDASTGSTYTVNSIGIYWVIVTDSNRCIGNSDTTKIVAIVPSPSNFIVDDTILCKRQTLTLIPTGFYQDYLWSTGETTNQIIINTDGIYWLMVTNDKGCQTKEYITVNSENCFSEVYFPNSFTPNNDGKNDLFKPSVFGTLERYNLNIYNRYGLLIYSSNNWFEGWDGKFSGALQNMGAYTWVVSYRLAGKKDELEKGIVLLIQ